METFKHNQHAGRTAIRRNKMSAPTKWLLDNGYLDYMDGRARILDYGAGQGDDVRSLDKAGFFARGYDPYHEPFKEEKPSYYYDIVLCNYVLNVTLDDDEMQEIMYLALTKARKGGRIYFTVRRDRLKEGRQRTGAYQRYVYPDKVMSGLRSIEYKSNAYEIYEYINV